MLNLETFLRAIRAIGPILGKVDEVKQLIQLGVDTFSPKDQEAAAKAYDDLILNNAEGYARLDAKLAEAEKK